MTAPCGQDRELLKAALRGDAGAANAFLRAVADWVWTACRRVTRDEAEAADAFRDAMAALRADGFARLKAYDGRASVPVYVTLVVRDLLSERVVKLIALDASRGWQAFEAFFADDMRRMIRRMLPGGGRQQDREDAYQAVCESLLNNDLARLRSFSGRGSPSGFVLRVIENLVIDYARTVVPRRRLPAAIRRLSNFDQSVFRLVYWEKVDPEPPALLHHLARTDAAPPTARAVAEALSRVRAALPAGYRAHAHERTADLSAVDEVALAAGAEGFATPTPEDALAEQERANLLEAALAALRQALPQLSADERLYMEYALAGQPARDIARLLGRPVADIHRLAQTVKRRLRDALGEDDVVKKWRLSV